MLDFLKTKTAGSLQLKLTPEKDVEVFPHLGMKYLRKLKQL